MEFIKKEVRNHIAYITMDRPPVNALNRQMYEELTAVFCGLYDDGDDVRIAILRSAGKHFIAGNDINEIDENGLGEMAVQGNYFNNCIQSICNSPVPVIGAVNGAATGAGFCVAACCDILVAAEGARFGLPEMKVGVIGGMAFLPAMVPQKLGRYMTLTGNLVPAEKLENYGSVYCVVPKDQLLSAAEKLAEEILAAPPLSIRAWKKCVKYIDRLEFASIEHITDLGFYDLADTEDAQEATRAFLEKRPPVYKGR